jgi:hypothetical protein
MVLIKSASSAFFYFLDCSRYVQVRLTTHHPSIWRVEDKCEIAYLSRAYVFFAEALRRWGKKWGRGTPFAAESIRHALEVEKPITNGF